MKSLPIFLFFFFTANVLSVTLEDIQSEKVFETYTWEELVTHYRQITNEEEKKACGLAMAKAFSVRKNIINRTLVEVYCRDMQKDKPTSANPNEQVLDSETEPESGTRGEVLRVEGVGTATEFLEASAKIWRIQCDARNIPEIKYKTFGSESPTSDFDFSLSFISKEGEGYDVAISNFLKSLEVIKSLENALRNYPGAKSGLSMSERFDANCYPEILENYRKYFKDITGLTETNRVENIKICLENVYTMRSLKGSLVRCKYPTLLKYINALNMNINTFGAYWYRKSAKVIDVFEVSPEETEISKPSSAEVNEILSTKILNDFSMINALNEASLVKKIESSSYDNGDGKTNSFQNCLQQIENSEKWNSFVIMGSCHIYATEAYITFGALETAMTNFDPKINDFSCPSLLESAVENFGMMFEHFLKVGFEKNDKNELPSQTKEGLDSEAFANNMKYFLRMMKSFDVHRCTFIKSSSESSDILEWNLLEKSSIKTNLPAQLDFFDKLLKVEKKAAEDSEKIGKVTSDKLKKLEIAKIYKEKVIEISGKTENINQKSDYVKVLRWLAQPFFLLFKQGKDFINEKGNNFVTEENNQIEKFIKENNLNVKDDRKLIDLV